MARPGLLKVLMVDLMKALKEGETMGSLKSLLSCGGGLAGPAAWMGRTRRSWVARMRRDGDMVLV